mgnify:CR=1 FL=1|jgi:hypothetical protein
MANLQKSFDTKRRERNSELVRRMRDGDPLTSFSNASSWFPPRPIIQKDSAEIARLYDEKVEDLDIKKISRSHSEQNEQTRIETKIDSHLKPV